MGAVAAVEVQDQGEGQEGVNGNDDRVDVEVGKVTGSVFVRAEGWDAVMRAGHHSSRLICQWCPWGANIDEVGKVKGSVFVRAEG